MRQVSRPYLVTALLLTAALCGIATFAPLPDTYRLSPGHLAAACLELALYVALAFSTLRDRLAGLPTPRLVWTLLIAAWLPYLVYSFSTGTFTIANFLALTGLTALPGLLYAARHRHADPPPFALDLVFLAVTAALILSKLWPGIYLGGPRRVPAALLGQLMWIRLTIASALFLRGHLPIHFGFWPSRREWTRGFLAALLAIAIAFPFAYGTGFIHARTGDVLQRALRLAPASFFGYLWVVALSEEFYFRGILMQALTRSFHHDARWALVLTSLLFGLVHLSFGHFPNWPMVCFASALGAGYGWLALQTRSLRASMVMHATVVTVWRTFFTS